MLIKNWGLAVFGLVLSGFGAIVIYVYVDTLRFLGDILMYWVFPLSAVVSLIGYWTAFYFKVSRSRRITWPLTLTLLTYPFFRPLAWYTILGTFGEEVIMEIPLLSDILIATELINSSEAVNLYDVSFSAFPLMLFVGFGWLLYFALRSEVQVVRCSNCKLELVPAADFCGSCGTPANS